MDVKVVKRFASSVVYSAPVFIRRDDGSNGQTPLIYKYSPEYLGVWRNSLEGGKRGNR
ncbi:hypothetical protein BofuT4_P062930.1 [Botrytis cinerea T4]|uniref:Uncharacterized protein n=1 Tax=Botryotinia fuckeliana (strain T4) TaxID=999810 RepID=G2XTM7_BOTF4|nr:hypothetical protein BofuT4_P062930.1 [Botrytis cinerea T4]